MSCTIPTRNSGTGDGCNNYKQCVQINKELDDEMHRIKTLKRKYNLDDHKEVQQMYMINPNNCDESKQMRTDPMMYMLDMSAEARCDNPYLAQSHNKLPERYDANKYRLNPNAGNNFTTEEEEYIIYPNSNIPVRKSDIEQRSKIRIYPHMYPQQPKYTEDEGGSDRMDIGRSLGGVDYPIPMRFQMKFLQDRGDSTYNQGIGQGGVDYDMRLNRNTKSMLPHPALEKDLEMKMSENVDFSSNRHRQVNGAITSGQFINNNSAKRTNISSGILQEKSSNARTIGAPSANKKDLTCSQQVRNLKQSSDVTHQSIDWYRSKHRGESDFYTDCEGCPREQRIADRQADILQPILKMYFYENILNH